MPMVTLLALLGVPMSTVRKVLIYSMVCSMAPIHRESMHMALIHTVLI